MNRYFTQKAVNRTLGDFFRRLMSDVSGADPSLLPLPLSRSSYYSAQKKDSTYDKCLALVQDVVAGSFPELSVNRNCLQTGGRLALAFFPSYGGKVSVCLFFDWSETGILELSQTPTGSLGAYSSFNPAREQLEGNQLTEDFIRRLLSALLERKDSLIAALEQAMLAGGKKDMKNHIGRDMLKPMVEELLKEVDVEYVLRLEAYMAYLDVKLPFRRKIVFELDYGSFLEHLDQIVPMIKQFKEQFGKKNPLKIGITGYGSHKWIRSR